MTYGRHSKGGSGQPSEPARVRGIESFRRHGEALGETGHGVGEDPRYPSARHLRQVLAFAVDWMLHAGPMIAVFVVMARNHALDAQLPQARFWALISWPVLSILDRVVVQGLWHGSVGKLLFGLVTIRPEDGGWPGFGRLAKVWVVGIFFWVFFLLSVFGNYTGGGSGSGSGPEFALPAVRRADVREGQ